MVERTNQTNFDRRSRLDRNVRVISPGTVPGREFDIIMVTVTQSWVRHDRRLHTGTRTSRNVQFSTLRRHSSSLSFRKSELKGMNHRPPPHPVAQRS